MGPVKRVKTYLGNRGLARIFPLQVEQPSADTDYGVRGRRSSGGRCSPDVL